jgi:hypothetical protein
MMSAHGALFLKWTAQSGTSPTLDVKIQCYDVVSAAWQDLAGAAFTQVTSATGTANLTIYPGIAETANVSVSDHIGRTWRPYFTIGGSNTPLVTFSLGGEYLA